MLRAILDLADVTVEEVMVHRRRCWRSTSSRSRPRWSSRRCQPLHAHPAVARRAATTSSACSTPRRCCRRCAPTAATSTRTRIVARSRAALVHSGIDDAAGPAPGVPPPPRAFRAGGRRVRRAAWASSRSRTSWRRSSATSPSEHEVQVPGVRRQPDGSYMVDGHVTIRDLNRDFDWQPARRRGGRPSPGSCCMRRGASPRSARSSCSTASASRYCGANATRSPACA